LLPTTNYFGKLSENLEFINTIISRETNRAVIEITSFPFRIGVRQLNVSAYPSRPFYTIDFNDYKIEDRVRGRFDESIDINTIQQEINREKDKIRNAMPLKLAIERDINEDVEVLKIEEITDKEGNSMNKNFIILQVQSMSEIDNFWLDSGVFSLSINNFNH
jgi:hypothetical protein